MADKTFFVDDEDASKKSSTGLDAKVANLLAYLCFGIGGLVLWLSEKENRFVKWNALQALISAAFTAAVWIVVSIIFYGIINAIMLATLNIGGAYASSAIGSAIGGIISGIYGISAVVAIIMGFQGKTFRIPGISKLTDKWFKM